MIRVYTQQEISDDMVLKKEQSHYITRVMRLGVGDRLRLFNEVDGDWVVEVTRAKPLVQAKVIEQVEGVPSCKPLHLFFAPVKQDGTNFIIQKATELGVTDFHPIITERSNTRRVNIERLQKNAVEAAEQCERLDVPKVHELRNIGAVDFTGKDIYVCLERRDANPIGQIRFSEKPVGFLVGPEGGLSDADVECLEKLCDFQAISLGSLILRAETACLMALAVRRAYES